MRALLDRIDKSAAASGLKPGEYRLDYKRNAKGELVVALIIGPDVGGGFSSLMIP
jgi:hypothetical protein